MGAQTAREAGAAVADAAMIDQELKDVTRAFTSATSSATNTAKYLLFGRQASDAASSGEYDVTYRKIQPPRRMDSASADVRSIERSIAQPRTPSLSPCDPNADCCIDSPRYDAHAVELVVEDSDFDKENADGHCSVDCDRYESL